MVREVYEAQNSVEAHVVLGLLEQNRITGHITGHYLEGGVGELQAMGLVRIIVNNEDYPKARAIVAEWDQAQPRERQGPPIHPQRFAYFKALLIALGGFFAGATAMAHYYQSHYACNLPADVVEKPLRS